MDAAMLRHRLLNESGNRRLVSNIAAMDTGLRRNLAGNCLRRFRLAVIDQRQIAAVGSQYFSDLPADAAASPDNQSTPRRKKCVILHGFSFAYGD
jgi:hypothetical protein